MNQTAAKFGLALHTTTPELGLALGDLAGGERSQVWNLGREKSSHLHLHLAEFLKPQVWANLAWIAVAKGPGGFTGTRIGVVTARTLAQQLEIPLFAISSLAAVAWMQRTQANVIAVQMPAQRGEVYGAIYQVESSIAPPAAKLVPLLSDTVFPMNEWQQQLATWRTPYHLVVAAGNLGETVTGVLNLAWAEWQQGQRPLWSDALPFYGQQPVIGTGT
jgi:tRNA threonylcarbamoyl adenosine modification protein YeaZ